jgi:hypothetical protein
MPLFFWFWLALLTVTGAIGSAVAARSRLHPAVGFVGGAIANVGAYLLLLDPPVHSSSSPRGPQFLPQLMRWLYLTAAIGLFAYAAMQTLVITRLAIAGLLSEEHLRNAAISGLQFYQAPGMLPTVAAFIAFGSLLLLWFLSLYLVYRGEGFPKQFRARWIVALLLFNVLAALAFVLWQRGLLARAGQA